MYVGWRLPFQKISVVRPCKSYYLHCDAGMQRELLGEGYLIEKISYLLIRNAAVVDFKLIRSGDDV